MNFLLGRIANWKTTVGGAGISSIFWYVFNSLECKAPADWMIWAVIAAPTILGMLGKDK